MHGYQLTFYMGQGRQHGHLRACDWLLEQVRRLGIRGVTVVNCAEGIGHAGAHHAAHRLRLADQPVQIVMAVTEDEAACVLDIVRAADLHVFYVRVPVEFGLIGGTPPRDAHAAAAAVATPARKT
jgi:PII-like signaling protein